MAVLEEEEEDGRSRDHMTKRGHTRTTHLWSHIYNHSTEFFNIRRDSFIFFNEMGRMLLQGRELLRLGTRYWLWAPNNWDTTSRL
jgi:hypothetical protein